MSKVYCFILNFILFFALIGGVAICSPSIKGYAISYTGSSVEPFSYVLSSSNGSSTDITEGTYTYIGSGVIELKLIAHNLSTSSKTIFANGDYSVYIDTTEGTYLLKSGNISGSAIAVNGSGTAVITQTISFNNFYLPGAFRSYYISGNVFTYEYNGSTDTYCSFSSATVSGFSHTESHYNTGDYTTILNNIYNELLSQGITLDNFYTELLDQGISLDTLVKSMCFDFPETIDGNYHLSTCFFNSSFVSNNNPLDLGLFAFDFSSLSSNLDFVVRVPSSRKLMFLSTSSSSDFLSLLSFVYNNGSAVSFTYEATNSFDSYARCYIISFSDSVPVGKFIKCTMFRNVNSFTGRVALYDYVVGANDILDYMKNQWSESSSAVSDLSGHSSNTGDMQVDVFETESSYFGDFDSAVSGAGIRGFSFSAFGGMTIFSAIVSSFYDAMPSELALYITAALIVGCIAVFISAVGRVIKKGGNDG